MAAKLYAQQVPAGSTAPTVNTSGGRRDATSLLQYLKGQAQFKRENVRLDSGEWIGRGAYSSLAPGDQSLLKKLGIQGYSTQKQADFEAANQKLGTGEYLPKTEYEKLSAEDKSLINKIGVDAFNQQKKADFEARNIQLASGDWVDKSTYNSLSDSDKQLLNRLGVDQFSAQKKADFEANNIQLDTGEWVDRTAFGRLTPADQASLKKLGVDRFNEKMRADAEAALQSMYQAAYEAAPSTPGWGGEDSVPDLPMYSGDPLVDAQFAEMRAQAEQEARAAYNASQQGSSGGGSFSAPTVPLSVDPVSYKKDLLGALKLAQKYGDSPMLVADLEQKLGYIKDLEAARAQGVATPDLEAQVARAVSPFTHFGQTDFVSALRGGVDLREWGVPEDIIKSAADRLSGEQELKKHFHGSLPKTTADIEEAVSAGLSKAVAAVYGDDVVRTVREKWENEQTQNMMNAQFGNPHAEFDRLVEEGRIPRGSTFLGMGPDGSIMFQPPPEPIDFDRVREAFSKESVDDQLRYIGGSGVAQWAYMGLVNAAARSGIPQDKIADFVFKSLNKENQQKILEYYASRNGLVPTYQEQIAASPIPQLEGMLFAPAGEWMAGQKVGAMDWVVGAAQLATFAIPVMPKGIGIGVDLGATGVFIADTAVEWKHMTPVEQKIAIGLNSLMVIASGLVFVRPIQTMLKGGKEYALIDSIVNRGAKETARTLKKVSPELVKPFQEAVQTQRVYASDLMTVRQLEKTLAETAGEVRPAVEEALEKARIRLEKSQADWRKAAETYVAKSAPLIDDPAVKEAFNHAVDGIQRTTEDTVNRIVSPRSVDVIKSEIRLADQRLRDVMQKYPNSPSVWSVAYQDTANLRAELLIAEMGDLRKLTEQLARFRAQVAELEQAIKATKSESLRSLYESALRVAREHTDTLPGIIQNYLYKADIDWAAEGPTAIFEVQWQSPEAARLGRLRKGKGLKMPDIETAAGTTKALPPGEPTGLRLPPGKVAETPRLPPGKTAGEGRSWYEAVWPEGQSPFETTGSRSFRGERYRPEERLTPEDIAAIREEAIQRRAEDIIQQRLQKYYDRVPESIREKRWGESSREQSERIMAYIRERWGDEIDDLLDIEKIKRELREAAERSDRELEESIKANQRHADLIDSALKKKMTPEKSESLRKALDEVNAQLAKQKEELKQRAKVAVKEETTVERRWAEEAERSAKERGKYLPEEAKKAEVPAKKEEGVPAKASESTPAKAPETAVRRQRPEAPKIEEKPRTGRGFPGLYAPRRTEYSPRQGETLGDSGIPVEEFGRMTVEQIARRHGVTVDDVTSTILDPALNPKQRDYVILKVINNPSESSVVRQVLEPVMAVEPQLEPAARPQFAPLTESEAATVTQTEPAQKVQVEPAARIVPAVVTPVVARSTLRTPSGRLIPVPHTGAESGKGPPEIPLGSITWASGGLSRGSGAGRYTQPVWYYIPPPYNLKDAIPLSGPPRGARNTDSMSAYETIQMIGEAGSRVPPLIVKDLGWADIEIRNGREIVFRSRGGRTDVGRRNPSPTTGMSVGDEGVGIVPDGGQLKVPATKVPAAKAPATKVVDLDEIAVPVTRSARVIPPPAPKRRPRRLSWYDRMTTLKGFRV